MPSNWAWSATRPDSLLSLTHTWFLLVPSLALLTIGQGLAIPNLAATVADRAPDDERGEALGFQQRWQSLGRIVGPIVAGALFQAVGVPAPSWPGADAPRPGTPDPGPVVPRGSLVRLTVRSAARAGDETSDGADGPIPGTSASVVGLRADAPGSMGYQPSLDGIRAIAVLGVLLYHADMHWIPGASSGSTCSSSSAAT